MAVCSASEGGSVWQPDQRRATDKIHQRAKPDLRLIEPPRSPFASNRRSVVERMFHHLSDVKPAPISCMTSGPLRRACQGDLASVDNLFFLTLDKNGKSEY